MTPIIDLDTPFQIGNTRHSVPLRDMLTLGSGIQTQVYQGVPAGSTGCTVRALPLGIGAGMGWVVLKPYTNECQIRLVTGISGNDITWQNGLTYELNTGDPVLWVTEPIVNVAWFGVTFNDPDNRAANSIALQRALDVNLGSGINKYTTYYFPGLVHVDASLNMTNKRYFKLVGNVWGNGGIVSYATGKPALDLLGARFFDISDLTIIGDSVNSPSVAMFFGRTVTGPNCGNCFIDRVTLDGKFSAAAIYNVSGEVISISRLRSGAAGLNTPYVFWSGITNGLGVTSDFETISYTYTGATQVKLYDWWLNGGTKTTIVRVGDKCHGYNIRDIYCNSYGGTGYALLMEHETAAGSVGIYIDGLGGEGSFAGGIKMVDYELSNFHFRSISLKGFTCVGTCSLRYGVIEDNGGLNGASQNIDASLRHVEIKRWYNLFNDSLVIKEAEGCTFDQYTASNITITTDFGGNIRRNMDQSPHTLELKSAALIVGNGAAAIRGIYYASASLDFGSIAAGARASLAVACPGATPDCVAFASPRSSGLEAGLVVAMVSAGTDSVSITLQNVSSTAIDPAVRTWYVCAFRGPV